MTGGGSPDRSFPCSCSEARAGRLAPPPASGRYSYSRKQRRLLLTAACGLLTFVLLVAGLAAASASKSGMNWPKLLPGGGGAAVGGSTDPCAWGQYRLPGVAVPRRYDINLEVQMDAPWGVQGDVLITVDITNASRSRLACLCSRGDS